MNCCVFLPVDVEKLIDEMGFTENEKDDFLLKLIDKKSLLKLKLMDFFVFVVQINDCKYRFIKEIVFVTQFY